MAFVMVQYVHSPPTAMRVLVRNGFPAEKIFYYRGGMLNWDALGLTTVPGDF